MLTRCYGDTVVSITVCKNRQRKREGNVGPGGLDSKKISLSLSRPPSPSLLRVQWPIVFADHAKAMELDWVHLRWQWWKSCCECGNEPDKNQKQFGSHARRHKVIGTLEIADKDKLKNGFGVVGPTV